MSAMISIPPSQTDPYQPEKSNEKPVKLRLTFLDGRVATITDGHRVMTTPPVPLKFDGVILMFRGVGDDGARQYRETRILDLDGLSELQKEYVTLTEKIENPVLQDGFGCKSGVTGVEHGTAVVRRQEIAFHLVDEEISRVLKGGG